METQKIQALGKFLRNELTISAVELDLVMEKQAELSAPIPMLLWQYGLVSRSQLERVFDWMEEQY